MPSVVVLTPPEAAVPPGFSPHRRALRSQGVPQCVCQRPCVWNRTPRPAPSRRGPLRFCPSFVLLPEFSVNAAQLKSLEARLTGDEVLWVLQGLPLACQSLSCTRHCAGISDHPCKPRSETEPSVDCFQRVLTPPWPPSSRGSLAAGSGYLQQAMLQRLGVSSGLTFFAPFVSPPEEEGGSSEVRGGGDALRETTFTRISPATCRCDVLFHH